MNRRMGFLAAGGLAVALVAGGGTALAAATGPVSGTGVITGCYTAAAVNGSHALVLQNAGTSCPSGTSAISWDQTGPAGPAGPTGATGPQGPAGATGSAGPQGPAGADGANGANGTNGTNGSSVVTSSGAPTGSCTTGDTDIELVVGGGPGNGEVFSCESSGWIDDDTSLQGAAGPAGTNGSNGANGSSVVTSSGAPTGSCTTGDTDIELVAGDGSGNGEVFSCESGGWTDTGSSLQGPAGATEQQPETVISDDDLDLSYDAPFTQIPGLTLTVTVPAGAELLISTDGGAECDSSSPNAYSYVAVEVQINGSFSGPSYAGLDRVLSLANNANGAGGIGGWALEGTSFPLAAGTYTVSVEAEGAGSTGASGTIVGGNLESFQGLIGNLTVTVFNA